MVLFMGVPTGRKWIALSLMAVVLPVSLLATLRLTGILPEPPKPETITVGSVEWEIQRPQKYVDIKDVVENTYSNDSVSITVRTSIHDYHENGLRDPYWGRDGIGFTLNVSATALKGFFTSIVVEFLPSDGNSTIYITQTFSRYQNAAVTRIEGIGTSAGVTCIEAKVLGSPCGLHIPVEWIFKDQNADNHHLKVNFVVTYSDGLTYREAVMPIILDVIAAIT